MALPPGCVRIKFAFGVHGLDMKADEVVSVIDGTQAAYAGVKPQWKLLMIDGEEMVDETLIRPALMRKSKSGKKYDIVFSKTAEEMRADIAAQEAAEAAKRERMMEEERARKAAEAEKAAKEGAHKAEVDAKKAAYAEGQAAARKAASTKPLEGVTITVKERDGPKEAGDNDVIIKYVDYAEPFTLSEDGKLTQKDIDDVYCISAVMPNSFMHLSVREFVGDEEHLYIQEEPQGVWGTLTPKMNYFLYIQQDQATYEEDMKRMKEVWANAAKGELPTMKEGCSCLYGSPCVNPDNCKDWDNRYAVAKANGGNPNMFQ